MGKQEVRMPRQREEVMPRSSGAGGGREGWALSCRCSDLAGHPAGPGVERKALQGPTVSAATGR